MAAPRFGLTSGSLSVFKDGLVVFSALSSLSVISKGYNMVIGWLVVPCFVRISA